MLNNKKIFIVLLLTAILLTFSFSSCFALTEGSFHITEEEKTFIDDIMSKNTSYTYYFLNGQGSSRFVYFIDCPVDSDVTFYVDGEYLFCSSGLYSWYIYKVPEPEIYWSGSSSNGHGSGWNDMYSNTTIYTDSNKSEVFFQPPVLEKALLVQKLEGVEMSQVLQEVIATLPLTIVVVVSLVGLRKAFQMLSTLLRKA